MSAAATITPAESRMVRAVSRSASHAAFRASQITAGSGGGQRGPATFGTLRCPQRTMPTQPAALQLCGRPSAWPGRPGARFVRPARLPPVRCTPCSQAEDAAVTSTCGVHHHVLEGQLVAPVRFMCSRVGSCGFPGNHSCWLRALACTSIASLQTGGVLTTIATIVRLSLPKFITHTLQQDEMNDRSC